MITNENKKLAQWAMEFALKNGCQASRQSCAKQWLVSISAGMM